MSSAPSEFSRLIDSKRLTRNCVCNLLGDGAPFLVALIAIPRLVHALGTERFGLLTLVWMVIGYFNVFDLGVGRALTNLVAQHLGRGEEGSVGPVVWTAIILMMVLGVAGAFTLAALSHWIVYSVLKIPPALRSEALRVFYLFSLSIPAVIGTTAFRGVLEAHQRFGVAIAIRAPLSVYSFAAPLAILQFSRSLVPVVAVLVIGRFIGLALYVGACVSIFPALRPLFQWRSEMVRPLLSFGGWMTISNVLSPIMNDLDRFLVGALVSIQAVAFYATPYDIVTKLLIIPAAVAGVLFPTFSTTLAADPNRTRRLYSRALRILTIVTVPTTLVVVLAARPALSIWLGPEFAAHSSVVLQILAIGIFLNGLTQLPFALVQGAGRADWTAKLHMAEFPLYIAVFWVLTTRFGIAGTAIAWVLRANMELLVLIVMAARLLRQRSDPAVIATSKSALAADKLSN